MAALQLPDLATAEGRQEAISKLEPDFHGLMERKAISEAIQATLSNAGVKSIGIYSVIGETAQDVRQFATDHCNLDRGWQVVEIAGLIDLWNACKTRMITRHKAEAEAVSSAMPPPLNKTEAQDLKSKFETLHYLLEDKVAPSIGTLESLFEQMDSGELKVMSLVQFLSREDQETEPLAATIDKSGTVKVKKGHGEGKPPKSGEELRQKIKLLGHCYIFVQLKYPNRHILRNIGPNLFNKYADFLLGEHVAGLRARNSKGETVSTPSLDLVLSYEYQVRKQMVKLMNENTEMVEALELAMKDTTVKERYFLTPAALDAATERGEGGGRKSRSPRRELSWDRGGYGSFRSGKGKRSGGKSKGKGGKGRGLKTRTPDGRDICFAWNNRDQRCRFNCGRVHCCQYCFGPHPAHSCKGPEGSKEKDTAGGADASGK